MRRALYLLAVFVSAVAVASASAGVGPKVRSDGFCKTTTVVCVKTTYVGMKPGALRFRHTVTNTTGRRVSIFQVYLQAPLNSVIPDPKHKGKSLVVGVMPISVTVPYRNVNRVPNSYPDVHPCCFTFVLMHSSLAPHQTITFYSVWPWSPKPPQLFTFNNSVEGKCVDAIVMLTAKTRDLDMVSPCIG